MSRLQDLHELVVRVDQHTHRLKRHCRSVMISNRYVGFMNAHERNVIFPYYRVVLVDDLEERLK